MSAARNIRARCSMHLLRSALLPLLSSLPRSIGVRMASNTAGAAAGSTSLRSPCYCGALELVVSKSAQPIGTSVCHCTNCRSLSGARTMHREHDLLDTRNCMICLPGCGMCVMPTCAIFDS